MRELSVVTDIEGGNIQNVRKLKGNSISMEMQPDVPSVYRYPDHHCYWFFFRLEGAAGREVSIKITNCDWMPRHWKGYRPVYTYAEDPGSLSGVKWSTIDRTSYRRKTFSMVQRFEEDRVWIALRYPYTLTRGRRFIDSLEGRGSVRIEDLGRSALGNPVQMVVITDGDVPRGGGRGVLVYAREHGVEQDGSWVCEGMIEFLLSENRLADMLRKECVFMIVPIVSPDAAAMGRAVDPLTGSFTGRDLMSDDGDAIESQPLYRRIKEFSSAGNRLDICISFHNPHGTEPNIYPDYRPCGNIAREERCRNLHRLVLRNSSGYTTWKERRNRTCLYSVGRFARDFDSAAIIYEVNHQSRGNYLTLEELKGLGPVVLKGIAGYYGLTDRAGGRRDRSGGPGSC